MHTLDTGPHAHTLLTELVASGRLARPEPVATEALNHVLGQSAAAREALRVLANVVAHGASFGDLTFRTQVPSADDLALPDLVGFDGAGQSRIIVEAKFDAELMPSQSGTTYLDRLVAGEPGLLLFVLPPNRLNHLREALTRLPLGQALDGSAHVDSSWWSMPCTDGRTVGAVTWDSLLQQLDDAMAVGQDFAAQGDLAQLRDLVAWRTQTGWLPVIAGDLPDRIARQLNGLFEVTVEAARLIAGPDKLNNGSGDGGGGRYIPHSQLSVWLGVWLPLWASRGHGPIWILVGQKKGSPETWMKVALDTLHSANITGYSHGSQVAVPLKVPLGAERSEVVTALRQQASDIILSLESTAISDVALTSRFLDAEPAEVPVASHVMPDM